MQRVMWARPDEQTAYGTQVTVRTEQRVERATKAELSRTATTKRFLGFCETHFAARKSLGPSNGGYGKMMANQVEGASQAPDNGIRLGETASWPMVLSSGFV